VAPQAPPHGLDARHELVAMEGLDQVVVGAQGERLHLRIDEAGSGKHQNGRTHLGRAQRLDDVEAADVGKLKVADNHVILVELAQLDAFFAKIGRVNVERPGFEHQLDAVRHRTVVFDQKDAHDFVSCSRNAVSSRV
jgi:hypothetical protein